MTIDAFRRRFFAVGCALLAVQGCSANPVCANDVDCAAGHVCRAGACVDPGDAGQPADSGMGTDGGADAGMDAGFDGGLDAGMDAGMTGTDAGVDGGADAGLDGGADAGPPCRSDTDIAAIPGVTVFDRSVCTGPGVCTMALQAAIDTARDNSQALYLPGGDYPLTNIGTDPTNGNAPVALLCRQLEGLGPDAGARTDGRYYPCILIGSTCNPTPTRLVLDDSAADNTRLLTITTTTGEYNDSYNHLLRGLTLVSGNNPNAVALVFRAAQGSTLQDSVIDLTGAPQGTGIVGGPGSGGSIVNVTIRGGAIGLDYTLPGQQTTVTALTLSGQHTNAILKGGQVSFVGVGVRITQFKGQVAIDDTPTGASSSAVTLVDSSIDFAADAGPTRAAVSTSRSVYLENVYVRNATTLVDAASPPTLPLPAAGPTVWQHVSDAALAMPFGTISGLNLGSHVWAPGACATAGCAVWGPNVDTSSPPADLAGSNTGGGGSRHGWPSIPDFQSASTVVVSDVNQLQAALDAGTPVVLAKGEFLLRQTVHLHDGSRLVGLAPTLSVLEPDGTSGSIFNVAPVGNTQPALVDTDVGGDPLLAFVGLYDDPKYQPGSTGAYATAVRWSAGTASRFIGPFPNFLHNSKLLTGPLFEISGGGSFYNVWGAQESLNSGDPALYRVYLVRGTLGVRNDARFYEFDIEHAGTVPPLLYGTNAEIDHATGVYFYGVKNESPPGNNCMAISAHDSTDLHFYGHGGNGEPGAPGVLGAAPTLYDFRNVSASRVANLAEAFDQMGNNGLLGQFTVLRIADAGYPPFDPLERPALVILP